MAQRGVNKVILVGNIGQDPELRTFPDGGCIVNCSLATSETWNDKQTGEKKERTEWHRIVFRNKLAEIVSQYLTKGSKIYAEGSLRTRKWQDNNGNDQYSTEVHVMQMQMLDTRSSNSESSQEPVPASQPHSGFDNSFDDDIPF